MDKDIPGILNVLLPKVEKVIFTKSEHPRAAEPSLLVELGRQYTIPLESAQNVAAAIERAIAQADRGLVILVTGSLFTAAVARQIILKR